MLEQVGAPPAAAWRRRTCPLRVGGAIVLLLVLVATVGPDLAPQDPLQETYIKENYAGEWVKPPYGPLVVPGFWLGSDGFGRDLLSQLLWAVRPTLTLVLVVAALRLTVGLLVGLGAGWSTGRLGRALGWALSAAVSVPVIFVALCVVTLFGARYGVWAFIGGLILTGWGSVARVLAEHTRGIKQRPYLEAARALGASDPQLIYRHVLPQIVPRTWTMLAFEVSSALLDTATLGFLGYFIHSIWLPLGDWSGIRASGQPELGQMLASAFETRSAPWGMVVAGSVVYVAVLGFNMLGEGLRQRQDLKRQRQRADDDGTVGGRLTDAIEGGLFDPLSPWRRTLTMGSAAGALLVLIIGGGVALWQSQNVRRVVADLPVAGGHQWAMERHDPHGTLRAAVPALVEPSVRWVFEDPDGFAGGPVVGRDGTVYVSSSQGTLYALNPAGRELWRSTLAELPVGAPALNALDEIYVTDRSGGMAAYDQSGQLLWSVPGERYGAIAGPIAGPDGSAYYTTEGHVVGVTLDGHVKWRINLPFYSYTYPLLSLSPNSRYLFFEDVALMTDNGAIIADRTNDPSDRFFVGVDGDIYLGGSTALLQWRETERGIEISQKATFDARSLTLGFRRLEAAGLTPEQRVWLLFNSPFEHARLVWFNLDGSLREYVDFPFVQAWLAAIDEASTFYVCGVLGARQAECWALARDRRDPLWRLPLDGGGSGVNGAALVPGHLYVSTAGGLLYSIEPGVAP